ncbi:methyl-accepting chemotaxis protein [Pseudomonas aeruginosa]|uniref:methyl-accepting chemotaxis protein n=1 Tax=Pseudomonas aeruginosa TaxID=287 RepID=UPI001571E61D|nr:methyl-accepting chemotaxis protein [Pseudomonas aeruginosa]NTT76581.1 methyl-accepting chemotaxis protein [Pseudomonas aeruginosa]
MSLRSMPIATRAALSFALITALLVITGIFSLNRMGSLNEASSDISDNWLPSVRESAELNVLLAELRQVQLAHVLAADDSSKRFLESRMTEIGKELTDREGAYQRLISGADERSIYERYLATRQTLLQSQQTLVQMSRSKPLEETRQYTESTLLDQYRATQQQLQALIDFNVKGASQASHTADEVYDSAFAAVIGVLLVAGLATVVLAWLFTRSITQPIGEALRVAEVIASGDLTSRIDTSGRDEPAKLLVALQGMQAQLRQTIQQIGSSATQLASAAEELSAVTEQGNRSLTQQNDEIQMTAAVEEVARNASSTSDASSASEQSAQNGRQRVLETVQAIRLMSEEVDNTSALVGGLAEKAQDLSKVLDVIRGIAEQTNLLALNAAIEAARAGEQGRGFAVVADEVRALAHRTQESTREIEQMIANIQEGTGAAVGAMDSSSVRARNMLEIAEAAGLALNEIAERVGQINERTLVIASASEQQAQVAREVDRNLVNIRDISLQTSAGSNQTAAASQELSQLAIDLNNMVTRFVV